MKMTIKEPNILRKKGIEALSKELGPLGMTCFIRQCNSGIGDYTKEREDIQKNTTVREIAEEIYRNRQA